MKKGHRKQISPIGKANLRALKTAPRLKATGIPKLKNPLKLK